MPPLVNFYPSAAHPPPAGDTGGIGGAIDTGAALNELTDDLLIADLAIPSSGSESYRGILYARNEGSELASAAVICRNAAKRNSTTGWASIMSDSAADTGTVRITGKVSAAWKQENLVANGTATVFGSEFWDALTVELWEYLVGGAPAVPFGTLALVVNGETCAILFGQNSAAGGNTHCFSGFELALASAKNTALSAAGRKVDPSGISAYKTGALWSGWDQSLAVPTGALATNDYIGIVEKIILPQGLPVPAGNVLAPDFCAVGKP